MATFTTSYRGKSKNAYGSLRSFSYFHSAPFNFLSVFPVKTEKEPDFPNVACKDYKTMQYISILYYSYCTVCYKWFCSSTANIMKCHIIERSNILEYIIQKRPVTSTIIIID